MLITVLLIILILMAVGAFPAWPYSNTWGHGPWAIILVILLLVLIFGYR